MDLTSLLPLLMRKDGNNREQLLEALLPKTEQTANLRNIMSLMQTNAKPSGLSVIKEIAPNSYLGAMLKYYTRN